MRVTFVYLSGSKRGKTESFNQELIKIGSDPRNDIVFNSDVDKAVSSFHAELTFNKNACEFILSAKGPTDTFVNNRQISEIILEDKDTIEFGLGGPKVRFIVPPEEHAKCEPFREKQAGIQTIAGLQAMGRAAEQENGSALKSVPVQTASTSSESNRTIKIILVITISMLLGVIAILAYEIYTASLIKKESERKIVELSKSIEAERVSRGALEKKIVEERERLSKSIHRQQEMIETLRGELKQKEMEIRMGFSKSRESDLADIKALRENIKSLENERSFAENIIRKYGGGVCFIQGSYGFIEKNSKRFLRYQGLDEDGEPLKDSKGTIQVTLEGNGPQITINYTATGFLVHRKGLVLTNRHIIEPWIKSSLAKQLIKDGYQPQLIVFRAYFPNVIEPFDLTTVKASEKADIALLKINPRGLKLPVLKLSRKDNGARPGHPVVLLGYPTGFDVLLAKADNKTSKEILEITDAQAEKLAEELAKRHLIKPITTQGHISDNLPEQLVYDAQTTVGGSGGPLFNSKEEVIAINYAILREFSGSNFGVPIKFALELLK